MDNAFGKSDEFLEALPIGIIVLGPNWRIVSHNGLALKLLSIEIVDALADDFGQQVPSPEFTVFWEWFRGNPCKREKLVFDLNGKRINLSAQRIRQNNEDGVILALEDATKVKEFEDLKHEFIEAILHRLRAPLSTLETTLSIVTSNKAGKLDDRIKSILDMSYQEVIRLHDLSSDLRDLFFIETGLMAREIDIETFAISKIIEKAVARLEQMPSPYGAIANRLGIEGDSGVLVQADFDKLRQVLINLLKNAIVFSPGSKPIFIRVFKRIGCVSIQIQDGGIGIAKENIGLIFNKFYREDNEITRKIPGNGLGLFNAKTLIALMGGVIYCDSEKGVGTSFWMDFFMEEREHAKHAAK